MKTVIIILCTLAVLNLITPSPIKTSDRLNKYNNEQLNGPLQQTQFIKNKRDIATALYNEDDLEVAEIHLFRPLFRYRAQIERKRRLANKQ